MILTKLQIDSILKDNPNRGIVAKGVEYNKKMRLHIYGEGLKEAMTLIDGYEAKSMQTLRAKYARSNKDLFSRLGRPIDKVFSARGGSVYYNLPETQEKAARNYALNIRNGMSIRKWIEAVWKSHLLDDPFGVVFMEMLSQPEAVKAKKEGRSVVYPTYKSITSIFDYLPKGSGLEYIVFNVSKGEKKAAGLKEDDIIYRVVDDAFDYWVKRDGDIITILQEHSYPNYFGEVPGLINSDLYNPENEDHFLSFYDDVIELADNFLLTGSVKLTHQFLHGYPKYWEYADGCNDCAGTGYQGAESCKECFGTGKKLMSKVSDVKLLAHPDKDTPAIAPHVAGYVSPDKIFWEISTADLSLLEELMNVTLWGASAKVKTQGMDVKETTATEEMLDIKPEADRLKVISEMAERRHKFILDNSVKINLNYYNYRGASVNYGRRYMIEGPDVIWEKYSKARLSGSPVSVLEDLLIEYYEAKYQGDEVSLAIALKLMYVEPFVHLNMTQVDSSMSIQPIDKAMKIYFTEWLSTINEAMILSFSIELLREQLAKFCADKVVEPIKEEVKEF